MRGRVSRLMLFELICFPGTTTTTNIWPDPSAPVSELAGRHAGIEQEGSPLRTLLSPGVSYSYGKVREARCCGVLSCVVFCCGCTVLCCCAALVVLCVCVCVWCRVVRCRVVCCTAAAAAAVAVCCVMLLLHCCRCCYRCHAVFALSLCCCVVAGRLWGRGGRGQDWKLLACNADLADTAGAEVTALLFESKQRVTCIDTLLVRPQWLADTHTHSRILVGGIADG